jgi:hypothetical protein
VQDVVSVRVNIIKGMGSKSLRARELVASKISVYSMGWNTIRRRGDLSRGCRRRISLWCRHSQWAFWAWVVVFLRYKMLIDELKAEKLEWTFIYPTKA